MGVLVWLAIPIVTSIGAVLWLSRRGRVATPEQQQQGIADMQRFQRAMLRPMPKRED